MVPENRVLFTVRLGEQCKVLLLTFSVRISRALTVVTQAGAQEGHSSKRRGLPCSRPIELLRKEVIQPQVPLRLPCYDFTPVTNHSLGTCLPCGLAQPLLEQSTPMV
jgi:hypothetical protein